MTRNPRRNAAASRDAANHPAALDGEEAAQRPATDPRLPDGSAPLARDHLAPPREAEDAETEHHWPRRLHDDCIARRRAQGHGEGAAEIRGALDVLTLARVLYPTLTTDDALAVLTADEERDKPSATPGRPAPAGPGTVHQLDRYRR